MASGREQKIIGLLTEDSKLFFDLVKALRERHLPFRSLTFNEHAPLDIGVLLTSPDEINKMCFEPRIAVVEVEKAIRQAIQTLSGVIRFEELIIGVDPGKKPGIAVFANDEILEKQQANSSVECAHCLKEMVKAYSFDTSKLRIGHGAPESRKEILDKVGHIFTIVEIVDESRTTRRTRTPDIDAAISIAKSWKCLERIRNN